MKTLTTIETRSGCKTLRVTFTALGGLLLFLAVLAGCAVGPDYKRPELNAPAAFRPAATGTNDLSATNSLADLGWWQVMNDPQLQNYITEALTNSWRRLRRG
jgi:multidrug efflux system outer membrane protein